jgi:hypothetical protein
MSALLVALLSHLNIISAFTLIYILIQSDILADILPSLRPELTVSRDSSHLVE